LASGPNDATHALSDQVVVLDDPGKEAAPRRSSSFNRKLSKKRSTGRIDSTVAPVMALGVAPLRTAAKLDVEAMIA
jgi:hypothetical protein